MAQVITGLFLIAFGLWGFFDAWHYVLDVLKGGSALVLIFFGVLSLAVAIYSPDKLINSEIENS
jgi:hypothetical protein